MHYIFKGENFLKRNCCYCLRTTIKRIEDIVTKFAFGHIVVTKIFKIH